MDRPPGALWFYISGGRFVGCDGVLRADWCFLSSACQVAQAYSEVDLGAPTRVAGQSVQSSRIGMV